MPANAFRDHLRCRDRAAHRCLLGRAADAISRNQLADHRAHDRSGADSKRHSHPSSDGRD